jgi:hypothetical protein
VVADRDRTAGRGPRGRRDGGRLPAQPDARHRAPPVRGRRRPGACRAAPAGDRGDEDGAHDLRPTDGRVAELAVRPGSQVAVDQPLATVVPEEGEK